MIELWYTKTQYSCGSNQKFLNSSLQSPQHRRPSNTLEGGVNEQSTCLQLLALERKQYEKEIKITTTNCTRLSCHSKSIMFIIHSYTTIIYRGLLDPYRLTSKKKTSKSQWVKAKDIIQRLRVLIALAKDLGLVPSSYVVAYNHL